MKHILKRNFGGKNESGWIQPTCSCGWVGEKEYACQDYQHIKVSRQEGYHLSVARENKAIA